MVKRVANYQISKDSNPVEDEDETTSIAPPDVLATRKILKPKGRQTSFKPMQSGKIKSDPDLRSRLKAVALNQKYLLSLTDSVEKNVLDLRPLAIKYIKFYDSIEQGKESSPRRIEPDVVGERIGESKTRLPGDGSLKGWIKPKDLPSTETLFKNSVFNLNVNSSKQSSGVQPKGPRFSFDKVISDPIFKLDGTSKSVDDNATKMESGSAQKPVFDMSQQTPLGESNNAKDSSEQASDLEPNEQGSIPETPSEASTRKVDALVTGEETEDVLFSCKTKLFSYEPKNSDQPYKNAGLGELKVLKSPEGKSRILIRAEGSMRVILNTRLLSQASYLAEATNVKVPVANLDGNLSFYVLRVKTSELAEQLSRILNSAKAHDKDVKQ